MKSAAGDYYDGESSARRNVVLSLYEEGLHLKGKGIDRHYPLSAVTLSARLGSLRRRIGLPDGGMVEIDDGPLAEAIDRSLSGGGFFAALHRWESNLKLALTALTVTVALILLFFRFGIPVLAEQAASAIPPATETRLGEESLLAIDRLFFDPSALPDDRREELKGIFAAVAADLDGNRRYRLEFRSSKKLGANAFALPSGIVVLTDELVELSGHDEEILAVLAHEVGHVKNRHSLRQVMQNSATGLIIATITGDVFSTTSLAAAIPTMLADAKFSREMEKEADDLAVAYMRKKGIAPTRFTDMLSRLEGAKTGDGQDGRSIVDYFSTHPATPERIERLHAEGT